MGVQTWALPIPGHAGELRRGYLQLTQRDRETYDVLWKVREIDEFTTLKAKPQFPEGTEALTEVAATFPPGCRVQRWPIRVPAGPGGKTIPFSRFLGTGIDVLAGLVPVEGAGDLGARGPGSRCPSARSTTRKRAADPRVT